MSITMQTLLMQYTEAVHKLYGRHLKTVILYGSYARGDNTEESDIDIMILVDLNQEKIEQYSDEISELIYEYNVNYNSQKGGYVV